jgi:hypothetical protein
MHRRHSETSIDRSSNRSVMLSVEEILGLVIDDEDVEDKDEDGDNSDTFAESATPRLNSGRTTPLSLSFRSESLVVAAVGDLFPLPPEQRRAVTWHAIGGEPPSSSDNNGYKNAGDGDDDDDDLEELSQDGSMTCHAPESPYRPSLQRRIVTPSTNLSFRDIHTHRIQTPPFIQEIPPFNHKPRMHEAAQQKDRPRRSPPSPPPASWMVESSIDPVEANRSRRGRAAREVVSISTKNSTSKRPISRFDIFEEKLREDTGFIL